VTERRSDEDDDSGGGGIDVDIFEKPVPPSEGSVRHLEAIANAQNVTIEQIENYTRSSNPFGGMVCGTMNAKEVTFAPVPAL